MEPKSPGGDPSPLGASVMSWGSLLGGLGEPRAGAGLLVAGTEVPGCLAWGVLPWGVPTDWVPVLTV